jgi:hypothetical protein
MDDRTQRFPNQSDPKLGEVRAVLQRLQAFSVEPDSAEHRSAGQPERHNVEGAGHGTEGETGWTFRSMASGRVPIAIALTIAGLSALLGGTWLTMTPAGRANPPPVVVLDATPKDAGVPAVHHSAAHKEAAVDLGGASASAPAPHPLAPRPAMAIAQELLKKGRVQAARKQLLGLVSGNTADVAWMLARSYDPNFLAAIPAADAGPDIEQATRWYRAWHAAAVAQGLVPNSVSVERIIGSMR